MSPVDSPILLLLVSDSSDTRERLAAALLSAPLFYRIEHRPTAEYLQNGAPKECTLALVDHNLRDGAQVEVVRSLTAAGIAVVALIDTRDVAAAQQVVMAGASTLVSTPVEDAPLWEAVRLAVQRGAAPAPAAAHQGDRQRRQGMRGLLIPLYSPKGGTGTSVLAANLAVTLQERSPKGAVLVEIGEGGSCQALLLNLRPERTLADLMARYAPGDTDLINGVLATHSSGLRVLLAPPSAATPVPMDLLDDLLGTLQSLFGFVMVDVSTTARTKAMGLMRRADASLLALQPEMTALQQGRAFVSTVESSLPEVQLSIVMNRATMPGGIPADAIRRHLKIEASCEVPDEPGLVTDSVNHGIPFVIGHPRSGVARAIQKLGSELSPEQAEALPGPVAASKRSPFQWLSARGR